MDRVRARPGAVRGRACGLAAGGHPADDALPLPGLGRRVDAPAHAGLDFRPVGVDRADAARPAGALGNVCYDHTSPETGEWKKQRFAADDNITLKKRDAAGYQSLITEAAGRESSSYDDSGWPVKNLPAVENEMNPYPTVPEYYEDGVWYRRNFSIDNASAGKFIKLMFYSVNYLNL